MQERLAAEPRWKPVRAWSVDDEAWIEPDLVFLDAKGKPIRQDWLEDHLTRLCKEAEVPRLTPHKLMRHGGATLMLAQGVDIYTLKDILGHSTVKVTEGYAHVLDDAKRDAANRMDELFWRNPPRQDEA
jgi:site-specific recombinase XerD